MKSKKQKGFSLIELMIAVAIAATLVAIALPAYNKQVDRGRRAEAKGCIMDVASRLERHYTQFSSYTDELGLVNCGDAENAFNCGLNIPAECPDGNYTLEVKAFAPGAGDSEDCDANPTNDVPPCIRYEITVAQVGDRDKDCQTFSLNNAGEEDAFKPPAGGTESNKDFCWR